MPIIRIRAASSTRDGVSHRFLNLLSHVPHLPCPFCNGVSRVLFPTRRCSGHTSSAIPTRLAHSGTRLALPAPASPQGGSRWRSGSTQHFAFGSSATGRLFPDED